MQLVARVRLLSDWGARDTLSMTILQLKWDTVTALMSRKAGFDMPMPTCVRNVDRVSQHQHAAQAIGDMLGGWAEVAKDHELASLRRALGAVMDQTL